MSFLESVMGQPAVYRLWMAPFAEQKFLPVSAHNDLGRVRRVLDVGCGPGTNADHFAHTDYLGVDWNERYIRSAQKRLKGRFLVADAEKLTVPPGERFDFILANSLLHHLDIPPTKRLLAHLSSLLAEDGHVHIVELVLPQHKSIPRFLALADRGQFPRAQEEWRQIFSDVFEPVVFEPFSLTAGGVELWNKVYFKGKAKR
jgi:SAM-dependent methyltransferase